MDRIPQEQATHPVSLRTRTKNPSVRCVPGTPAKDNTTKDRMPTHSTGASEHTASWKRTLEGDVKSTVRAVEKETLLDGPHFTEGRPYPRCFVVAGEIRTGVLYSGLERFNFQLVMGRRIYTGHV